MKVFRWNNHERGTASASGGWLRLVGIVALRERLCATRVKKLKCLMSTGDEGFQNGLKVNASFLRVGFPALKINPAFVETVQHPDAWHGILHALRLEQRLPSLARHGFHPHRTIQELRESGGDFIRRHPARPF